MTTEYDNVPKAPATAKVAVGKSNELVNAVYRLSLVEAQLLHFCIAWSREQQLGLTTDKPLRLRVSDFAERFGIGQDNAYRQTKDALEAMYKREITMNSTDPQTGLEKVTRTRWISEYSYVDGAGVISVIFTPKVVEHITRLERAFTSYSLTEIAHFSSYYAVRLYELLMQFKDKGWRTVSIEELRAALGIGPTEYPRIANLKARAIDVAVAQINELSEWKVSYQNHKHGVKITGLTFNIRKKPVKEAKQQKPQLMDDTYVTRHARPGESWPTARQRLQQAWDSGINYDQQSELFEEEP
jgi:plasmid replication initiation protein